VTPELRATKSDLREAQRLERREPTRALGSYLACAKAAAKQLERQPTDIYAGDLYNFAVARSISIIETAPLDAWSQSLSVPSPDGKFVVTTIRHPGTDRDPANYTIIPAELVQIFPSTHFVSFSQAILYRDAGF
jgi:hypothetical protein